MNVLVVCDSFKGTITSKRICEIATLVCTSNINLKAIPIADGGEGTVDCFLEALHDSAKKNFIDTVDLFGRKIRTYYCLDGTTAIIEVASTSGLDKEIHDVANASTYGLGTMILDALDQGATNFIIGLGGSGTNDCGIGMASALGVVFLDKNNNRIPLTGAGLALIDKIDISKIDKRLNKCSFRAACDVKNILYGPDGAAYVFAPQKGADSKCVIKLDKGLRQFADVIKSQFNIDVSKWAGGGAAGGLGVAVKLFLNGTLESGVNLVLDNINFDQHVTNADIIITGEGCVDSQSLQGKVPYGVAQRSQGKKVICICGKLGCGYEALLDCGISEIRCINPKGINYQDAVVNCEKYMYRTLSEIMSEN